MKRPECQRCPPAVEHGRQDRAASRQTVDAMYALYFHFNIEGDPSMSGSLRTCATRMPWLVFAHGQPRPSLGFSSLANHRSPRSSGSACGPLTPAIRYDRPMGTQDAFTWSACPGAIKSQSRTATLYWFLIVKGIAPIRYLSAFSIDCHPHWQHPTHASAAIIRAIWRVIAQRGYDEKPAGRIFRTRAGISNPWAKSKRGGGSRPDVNYFLERNPGYIAAMSCLPDRNCRCATLRPLHAGVFRASLFAARRRALTTAGSLLKVSLKSAAESSTPPVSKRRGEYVPDASQGESAKQRSLSQILGPNTKTGSAANIVCPRSAHSGDDFRSRVTIRPRRLSSDRELVAGNPIS